MRSRVTATEEKPILIVAVVTTSMASNTNTVPPRTNLAIGGITCTFTFHEMRLWGARFGVQREGAAAVHK